VVVVELSAGLVTFASREAMEHETKGERCSSPTATASSRLGL
jgi:hypothetical protein